MIQVQFAQQAAQLLAPDPQVIGLAVGGSWITDELDEFSDLDLLLVTHERVSSDVNQMVAYAQRIGNFLSGFTGEHVGEPRLLICLYENPLLHVDIKFVTLEEFQTRVETPVLLLDKEGQLARALANSTPAFPLPDFQWMEDRFWIWIHYTLQKIGRGEYLEAYDFSGFLRMVVLGPLLHLNNGNLPRGVRKVETTLPQTDLLKLVETLPTYDAPALLRSLRCSVELYRQLRMKLFSNQVKRQEATEQHVMEYFRSIEQRTKKEAADGEPRTETREY
jgi:predicted nucleotidyltransferase